MKKTIWMVASLLLTCSTLASAQGSTRAASLTVSQALNSWVTFTEAHLVPLAEAMPEDKYSFAPTNGEFKGVRTFAEQVKHLSANNYAMAVLILGEKPTPEMQNETGPQSVRTKAEIVAYLKGSFTHLHQAVATIDEKNLIASVGTVDGQNTRVQFVIDAVAHSFNHYGQLVEYLRMNGVVPPESRPR